MDTIFQGALKLKAMKVGLTSGDFKKISAEYAKAPINKMANAPTDDMPEWAALEVINWTILNSMGLAEQPRVTDSTPVEIADVGISDPIVVDVPFVFNKTWIDTGIVEKDVDQVMQMEYRTMNIKLENAKDYEKLNVLNELKTERLRNPFIRIEYPRGYPRTLKEKNLASHLMQTINIFGRNCMLISGRLTKEVRANAASWKMPDAKAFDMSNVDDRRKYLKERDDNIYKVEVEAKGLIRSNMAQLAIEGVQFLKATAEMYHVDQDVFENYLSQQISLAIDAVSKNSDLHISAERASTDYVKLQFSNYGYDKMQYDAAVEEAKKKESKNCTDIFKKPLFWVILIAVPVVAVGLGFIFGPYETTTDPDGRESYGPSKP